MTYTPLADPDGGDWTPGPPWIDRLMVVLGVLSLVGLALAALKGLR